jgi:hypothetical protein
LCPGLTEKCANQVGTLVVGIYLGLLSRRVNNIVAKIINHLGAITNLTLPFSNTKELLYFPK